MFIMFVMFIMANPVSLASEPPHPETGTIVDMIPVRLSLKNFMSYGEEKTTLEFAGIHVASLSGDNGNGKSALLDAVTYALWGKTRASGSQASGEDDLVRLGAEDMEVEFEFRLGDDLYRTTRKRNRRTHTGDWQLHLQDITGAWQPAGGSAMSETGRHIARLLHMEYETFLNSAYIQQGRADEFTRQKPNDRKRILGDILDLSRYDRLEGLARERRSECDLALKDLEGEIRHLEARAGEAAGVRERLKAGEADVSEATEARDKSAQDHETLAAQMADLEEKDRRASEMEARLKGELVALADVEHRIKQFADKMARDANTLASGAAIRSDVERLKQNRLILEELEPAIARLSAAKQERAAFQARIDVSRQQMLRDLDRAEADCRLADERARQVSDLDRRITDISPKLAQIEKALTERETLHDDLERVQERFTEMAAASRGRKAEIAEMEEVIHLLGEPKPSCPVCESDLSGGRQQAVLQKQQDKLAAQKRALVEINHDGGAAKKQRDHLQIRMNALEVQARNEAALRAQRAELMETRERLTLENANRADLAAAFEAMRCRLEAGDFAKAEKQSLAALEDEMKRLAETEGRYATASLIARDLASLQVERKLLEVEQAEKAQGDDAFEMSRLKADHSLRAGRLTEERQLILVAHMEIERLPAIREAAHTASVRLRQATAAREHAMAQVERLRQTLEDCAKVAEQSTKKRVEIHKLAKDKQAYAELAAAFSKRGVQAHIIDNALPEIEDEANHLLARLTDNAMQISLSTLRQARTGSSQIETLDISITDEAGTRPYEMYSGGEAFRVNFAIRIALSRLLARRAGARLQTLILDEGFGTQDAKGRERLIEAIEAVKDEFSLILVISHIEELKDAFPTRIEVTKTSAGSQITYVD